MARFALVPLLCAQAVLGHVLSRGLAVDFINPAAGGGSWLDNAGGGFGEPLNVVISGLSSPNVLTDSGFLNFARSLGLSAECLGLHRGDPQLANLGDGNGSVKQTVELRKDFRSSLLGTCLEVATGGNHLRMFRQNGSTADTGALFLAVSEEEDILQKHTISPNGYDAGRDKLVTSAVGTTKYGGVTYSTTKRDLTGFIQPGSAGINHGIATDGVVKLLTVTTQ